MSDIPLNTEQLFAEAGRVLVFGAHADDIDVTSGGTIALLTDAGREVTFCIVTDGSKGGRESDASGVSLQKAREAEQRAAAQRLGVQDVKFLGFVDGELENTLDVRRAIVGAIRETQPDTVLTWDPSAVMFDNWARYHRDHRIAGEAVYDALYPAAGNDLYFSELATAGFAPHEPKHVWFFGTERPNIIVDVKDVLKRKIEAIGEHESQMPHLADVEKMINAQAQNAGKSHGVEYAETFRYLRFRT